MRCTRFLAKAVLFAAALLIIQPVPVNAQGRPVKISVNENGGAKLDHRAANRSCFWAE